jgi:hypothetical protein
MEYLVDRYDSENKISFPKGTREWYAMKNWLYFQNAGIGPMQGQASKCFLLSPHSCLLFPSKPEILWTCHLPRLRFTSVVGLMSSFNLLSTAAPGGRCTWQEECSATSSRS